MREACLIKTAEIETAGIEVGHRLRPVSAAQVEALCASIRELGRITDPVHVRRAGRKDGRLVLIAGAHRVAAAAALGLETVPAHVWDCPDDWARLLEIDDNLAHGELSPLDRAVFLAQRKETYERLHPEARHGGDRKSLDWHEKNQTDMMSFCSATADQFGLTARHVRRLVSAGLALGPDQVALLRAAPRRVTLQDLQTLARIHNAAERHEVVRALSEGRERTATKAWKAARFPVPGRPEDATEAAHRKLIELFDRAPMAAKRRFVRDAAKMLRRLLSEHDAAKAAEAAAAADEAPDGDADGGTDA